MDTTALVIPHLLSRVDYVLIDVGAGISFQCFKERQHKETLLSPRALELTFVWCQNWVVKILVRCTSRLVHLLVLLFDLV